MGFSSKQVAALRRNVDERHIRVRQSNGRELSYLEGWYVISQANRIFGFDGWSRETLESKCVLSRENRGYFTAVYTARSGSPSRQTGRPSSARDMGPVKGAENSLARSTT